MNECHSRDRDRGALEDPYRGNRLEVSYRGRCCCGCGCCACCIGHPGREVYGPALKALRSHLHKGTTVGRAQRAVHWAWRGVWGTSFLLLPLRGIISTHVIPNQCTAATLGEHSGPVTFNPTAAASLWGEWMLHLLIPNALTNMLAGVRLLSWTKYSQRLSDCTLPQGGASVQRLPQHPSFCKTLPKGLERQLSLNALALTESTAKHSTHPHWQRSFSHHFTMSAQLPGSDLS